MRRDDFTFGFVVGFSIFVIVNLVFVHFRSDGGLLEGLGLVDHSADDVRCIGVPFQFFEEGGYSYRRVFSPWALFLNALVAIACSTGVAILHAIVRMRRRQ